MNSASRKENYASAIRAALFFIILAWMLFGPAYRQVFGGENKIFRSWTMFENMGIDPDTNNGLMDATFYVVNNGELTEINRFEILGYDKPKHAPEKIFRITGDSGIKHVSESLCKKLGNDTDLRVKARMATKQGWKTQYNAEKNLCNTNK